MGFVVINTYLAPNYMTANHNIPKGDTVGLSDNLNHSHLAYHVERIIFHPTVMKMCLRAEMIQRGNKNTPLFPAQELQPYHRDSGTEWTGPSAGVWRATGH